MKRIYFSAIILCVFFLISFNDSRKSKSEILNGQGVYAVMPADFEFDFKYKVISYEWVLKTKNDTYFGVAKGSKYPDDLIKHIKDSKPNDILFIENVKVIGDDKFVRKLAGLSIVLK